MDAARDRFAEAGCSILIVSQAKPDVLTRYLASQSWHVPIVSDPDRAAYAAFGLERTSWLTFFRPKVLRGYFRGMAEGYKVQTPYAGEDVLQLGGDFILTRERTMTFAYRSADPTDRPTVESLVEAVHAVASARTMPTERSPDHARVDAPPPNA